MKIFLQKRKEPLIIILGILCIFCVCVTLILVFVGGAVNFHSDAAATNRLVMERIRSGSFFPPDWYYVNGSISILGIDTLMMPLALIVKDPLLLRAMSCLLWLILFALAVIWFHRTVFTNYGYLISIPLLFCGFSGLFLDMFAFHGGYTPTITLLLIGLTIFLKTIYPDFRIINKSTFIMLVVFLFIVGGLGINMAAYFAIPLLMAILLYYVIENFKASPKDFKTTIIAPAMITVILMIATGGGLLVNKYIIGHVLMSTGASSPSYISMDSILELQRNCFLLLQSLLAWCGLEQNVTFFSIRGLLNILKVGFCCFVWFVGPILYFKDYKKLTFYRKLFGLFFVAHVFVNIYMLLFCRELLTNIGAGRYLFTSLIFAIIILADVLLRYFMQSQCLARYLAVLCIIAIVVTSGSMAVYTYYRPDIVAGKYAISNFLKEEGLSYGYATFWNAGNNTALSDYEVEIVSVVLGEANLTPHRWLSAEHWYDPNNHFGETFLMLTRDEYAMLDHTAYSQRFGEPVKVLEFQSYIIYVYPYNLAERAWLYMDLESDVNLIPGMQSSSTTFNVAENSATVLPGGVLYGPYIHLDEGEYILTFDCTLDSGATQTMRITAECGKTVILEKSFTEGINLVPISLSSAQSDVEFVFNNIAEAPFTISNLKLTTQ